MYSTNLNVFNQPQDARIEPRLTRCTSRLYSRRIGEMAMGDTGLKYEDALEPAASPSGWSVLR